MSAPYYHGGVRDLHLRPGDSHETVGTPSFDTAYEFMALFCRLAACYELLYCCISVQFVVEVYFDRVCSFFIRARKYVRGSETELPPRLSMIPLELKITLDLLYVSIRQHVSCFIVLYHERGRTGSTNHVENAIDMMGKNYTLGKWLNA